MHIAPDDLIEALRSEGLRITAARRAVCEVLAEGHSEHLSAADVLGRASVKTHLDQSTVYRTLEVLEQADVITHTHLGHGALVYHLADEAPHQHLVCNVCGTTIAIPESHLGEFFAEITVRTGFVPDPSHVALSGTCTECGTSTE